MAATFSRKKPTFDLARLDANGFDRLYEERIAPAFAAAEPARLAAVAHYNKCLILTIAAAIAASVAAGFFTDKYIVTIVGVMIGVALGYGVGMSKLKELSVKVKVATLEAIAKATDVKYSLNVPMDYAIHGANAVGLVPEGDRTTCEDLFQGYCRDWPYELFDAHIEARSGDKYKTVFRGQVVRIKFPRKCEGLTLVLHDAGAFNSFSDEEEYSFGGKPMKRVRLEDPKFEKAFQVYGTDQVESRYLVHPVFMERLAAMEKTFAGEKLRCAFAYGELFVIIEGRDRFELGADLFKPLSAERARGIVADLASVVSLVDAVISAQTLDRSLIPPKVQATA